MSNLLDFLHNNRVGLYFIFLQVISIWLIVSFNGYYGAVFFNSSNALSGNVQNLSQNASDYFSLKETNSRLAMENAFLREQLANSSFDFNMERLDKIDFEVIPSRIINKSYLRSVNFFTLASGKSDGVKPGMGVLGGRGVMGRVQSVSGSFCTVASILNPNVMISCQVKSTKTLCTAQWLDQDYQKINILYVPRHTPLRKGDTIETSGYNSVYPPQTLVGIIDSARLSDASPFYFATAKLTVDFSSVDYGYIVINKSRPEIDSIESILEDIL